MEQYIGGEMKKFTPATDIYSAGATLFYMLTATRLPEPDEISEMKKAFPYKFFEGKRISSTTVDVIAAAMQVGKADRPQTVAAFLALLNKQEDELNPEVDESEDTIPDYEAEKQRRQGEERRRRAEEVERRKAEAERLQREKEEREKAER